MITDSAAANRCSSTKKFLWSVQRTITTISSMLATTTINREIRKSTSVFIKRHPPPTSKTYRKKKKRMQRKLRELSLDKQECIKVKKTWMILWGMILRTEMERESIIVL